MSESNYVSFEYEPIDSVSAYALSGFSDERETVYRPVSSEDGLRVLVEKARSLNADGIINLKFDYFPGEIRKNDSKTVSKGGSAVEILKRELIVATGMAIKRKY